MPTNADDHAQAQPAAVCAGNSDVDALNVKMCGWRAVESQTVGVGEHVRPMVHVWYAESGFADEDELPFPFISREQRPGQRLLHDLGSGLGIAAPSQLWTHTARHAVC